MKSKTSLFNKTIFTKNIKRVWPFWGLLSFAAVIPSLFLLMEWIRSGFKMGDAEPVYIKEAYLQCTAYVAPFVAFATAIIVAVAVWSYLDMPKSVGFYHSIPVTRTGLFITSYLSGLAIMLIPYAIGGTLFILTLLITGCGFNTAAFVLIGAVILDSIFFFSFATVIAMMTGHVLALPVLYFVFNFLALGIENLFSLVLSNFLFGFDFDFSDRTGFLSPVYYLISKVNLIREYDYQDFEYGYSRETIGVSLENGHLILIYGAVGVVLAVIALLMYKKRKSESAGDVVSSKVLKPIILSIYTIAGTTILGMILYYIFSEGVFECMSIVLGSVCFIVALFISYYTGLMLLEKSVGVFTKKAFRGFLVGVAVVIITCVGMRYDFFGIETRVPDASKIKTVQVYAGNYFEFDGSDKELVEKARAMHKAIIDNKDMLNDRLYGDMDEDCSFTYVSFTYELKNGEVMSREYRLVIAREHQNDFDKSFIDFISDKDVVRTLIHENDNYYITGGYFNLYSYDSMINASIGLKNDYLDLSVNQATGLYEAVVKDLEEGNWRPGVTEYTNNFDVAVGYIDIAFEERMIRSENSYYYNSDDLNVNFTSKMTNTIEAVAEMLDVPYDKLMEVIKEIEKNNSYDVYYEK